MAIIKTSKGIEILIDDDKFEDISQYNWYVAGGYACTKIRNEKTYMHRLVTSCPKGMVVDHVNMNKLDNRLENLDVVTRNENSKRAGKHYSAAFYSSKNKSKIV